jgi:hypothetical protein
MSPRLTSYLVTDIEANGLVPGRNSMISMASVAIDQDGQGLGSFEINLEPAEGTSPDPDAMAWWETEPEAWREATRNPVPPAVAVERFIGWGQGLPGERIFVAHPLLFDGGFVAWYLDRFAGLSLYDLPRHRGLTVAGLDLPSLVLGSRDGIAKSARRTTIQTNGSVGMSTLIELSTTRSGTQACCVTCSKTAIVAEFRPKFRFKAARPQRPHQGADG